MAQIRLINLVEYLAGDKYAMMEDAGETQMPRSLDLVPDSPEWFAWLESLPSFHFKGRSGYFTARHERAKKTDRDIDAPPLRYWYAYRKQYNKQQKHYLGVTRALTIAKLEEVAEALHTAVLGSLPEDEILNQRRQRKPEPQGIQLGSVTFLWDENMLEVKSAPGAQFLNQRQAGELLAYLYEHRDAILKERSR
jgi:hypothetical protein